MLASALYSHGSSSNGRKITRPTPAYSVQATRAQPTNGDRAPLPEGVIGAAVNGNHDYRAALDKGGAVDWLEGKQHPARAQRDVPATRQTGPLESSTFEESGRFVSKEWQRPEPVASALQSQSMPSFMRDVPPPLPVARKSVTAPEGVGGVGLRMLQAPGKRPCVSDYSPSGKKDPAFKSKICIGDVVLMVNGKPVTPLHTVEDVERMLAGSRGSICAVRLLRRVPLADGYTRQRLLEQEGSTESEDGVVYGVELPRLDDEVSTMMQEARPEPPGPDVEGERLIVRVPRWTGTDSGGDYGEEPLWAVQQATRRGLVYEPGKGFVVPQHLMKLEKPDDWDEEAFKTEADGTEPALLPPMDAGRGVENLTAEEDLVVRHEQMVQQFNDLAMQRGGQPAPAEVTATMRGILDEQERTLRPTAPLGKEVSRLQESKQEITRAALSLFAKYLAHSNAPPPPAPPPDAEVVKARQALAAAREEAEARTRELVKARADADVAVGKLQLEKSTVEARLRAEIGVLREGLENAKEYAGLREKMERLLQVKDSVTADRDVLQAELERVKASRLHDGMQRPETVMDTEPGAGGMTRAIVADIETLSLTNAQLVLDLHRLKDEKKELEKEKLTLRSDRTRMEEIVDRKNEELSEMHRVMTQPIIDPDTGDVNTNISSDSPALKPVILERMMVAETQLRLREQNAALQKELENKAQAAAKAKADMEKREKLLAEQVKMVDAKEKKLEKDFQTRRAALEEEMNKVRQELYDLSAERQQLVQRTDDAERRLEEATRDQVRNAEKMKTQLQAARAEAETSQDEVANLRKSMSRESDNIRQAAHVLQGDIKVSNETLREALKTALDELDHAKTAVNSAERQVADKTRQTRLQDEQIERLQAEIQQAKQREVEQAAKAGCLACRRALQPQAIAPALQLPAGYADQDDAQPPVAA